MDTKAHVTRIESQRKMDDAKALAIAKKDPLYDYYQSLKEKHHEILDPSAS